MIKRYTREVDTNRELFETDIPNSIKSPTLKYFSQNGYLEKEITKIYWEYLSQTIEHWEQVTEELSQEVIDKILSRHTLSCLNEKLYVNGNIGRFDKYHFGEMYVIPPIKQHYHTGDIIKNDKEYFIILNPACDIVNVDINKPYILLCCIGMEAFSRYFSIKFSPINLDDCYITLQICCDF